MRKKPTVKKGKLKKAGRSSFGVSTTPKKGGKVVKQLASTNIVSDVTAKTMAGDNSLEKEVNAFLTRQFIMTERVPDDECLSEAREVIAMVYNAIGVDLVTRLHAGDGKKVT